MKRSSEEWRNIWKAWQLCRREFNAAEKQRNNLFEKAKQWLGCHPEFGNMESIAEMLEREIGRAVLDETKDTK